MGDRDQMRLRQPNDDDNVSRVTNIDTLQVEADEPASAAPAPASGHRRTAVIVAAVVAGTVALVTLFLLQRAPEPVVDTRPVVLPKTLQGLPMADSQFADTGWRTTMRDAKSGFGDHPFDGRSYQATKRGPMVNLVVVRDDAQDKGDLYSEHKPFTTIGHVSCRHPFPIDRPVGTAGRDNVLTCWRASETLTVSVLVLPAPPGYEKTMAKAIDEVWALQQ